MRNSWSSGCGISSVRPCSAWRSPICWLQLPVMQVSDRLTDIAELIVERALQLTWQQLTPRARRAPVRRGCSAARPVRLSRGRLRQARRHGAGLRAPISTWCSCMTPAARSRRPTARARIDNQVFFVRFAQRVVHLLTMHSAAGRLYEVDMRLRPSGKGGMLITSIEAFAGLPAPGGLDLGTSGAAACARGGRAPALRCAFRGAAASTSWRSAVSARRCARTCATCATACATSCRARRAGEFDLKQDPGGIADIEFLAQYWALRWAQDYPPVAMSRRHHPPARIGGVGEPGPAGHASTC